MDIFLGWNTDSANKDALFCKNVQTFPQRSWRPICERGVCGLEAPDVRHAKTPSEQATLCFTRQVSRLQGQPSCRQGKCVKSNEPRCRRLFIYREASGPSKFSLGYPTVLRQARHPSYVDTQGKCRYFENEVRERKLLNCLSSCTKSLKRAAQKGNFEEPRCSKWASGVLTPEKAEVPIH